MELPPTTFRQRATRLHLYEPSPFTALALLLLIAFVGFDTTKGQPHRCHEKSERSYSCLANSLSNRTLRYSYLGLQECLSSQVFKVPFHALCLAASLSRNLNLSIHFSCKRATSRSASSISFGRFVVISTLHYKYHRARLFQEKKAYLLGLSNLFYFLNTG